MRVGMITGKTKKGDWVTLAAPDVPIVDQKAYVKQLREVNGKNILVGGERVDLVEVYAFDSGSGKHVRFKEAGVSKVGNPPDGDYAANLKVLAEKLELTKEELDELRGVEGFPEKEKAGYNVDAVRAVLDSRNTAVKGDDDA